MVSDIFRTEGPAPTTALLLPAVTPLSFGDLESDIRYLSLLSVWCFGVVESIASVTLLWTAVDVAEGKQKWVYGAAMFASIGALGKWTFMFCLLCMGRREIRWMAQERTDLKQLFAAEQWTELAEIIIFKMGSVWSACKALFVEFLKYSLFPFCSHFVIVISTISVSEGYELLFFGRGVTVCSKRQATE